MNWWQFNQRQWERFLMGRSGGAALWVILESSAALLGLMELCCGSKLLLFLPHLLPPSKSW